MISLHNNSHYSMLTGIPSVSRIASQIKNLGHSAFPLTDLNGMYGFIDLSRACKENNLKPIYGVKLTKSTSPEEYILVISRNPQGYKELCSLISSRQLNDEFSLEKVLKDASQNLFYLTPNPELLKINNISNIYAEIKSSNADILKNKHLYNFVQANSLNYILTNPSYFLDSAEHILVKVLAAIRLRKTIETLDPEDVVPEDYSLKSEKELAPWCSQYSDGVENAEKLIRECGDGPELGHYKFPRFHLPAGEDAFSFLWRITFNGFERKVKNPTQEQRDRLNYELEVIAELNFIDYFLVVWDIVREAKTRGVQIIGRGSAANSLVAYALDLVDLNPTEHDLYFERFLNRGRISPPDVDLDFSWKERDEMIKYVFNKYGYHRVAMISTTVTFRARSAFRETAKAFGIPDMEISKLSKFIPWTNAANLENITSLFPESKNLPFNSEPWKSIVSIASRLADAPRFLGIHPGGIVIAPEKITDHTAVQYSGNKGLGIIVTQPDMYSIEDLGLIKIDLLSQRSLGVLRDSLRKIKRRKKRP